MVHLTKEERERAKDISYKAMIKLYPHRSLGNQYLAQLQRNDKDRTLYCNAYASATTNPSDFGLRFV